VQFLELGTDFDKPRVVLSGGADPALEVLGLADQSRNDRPLLFDQRLARTVDALRGRPQRQPDGKQEQKKRQNAAGEDGRHGLDATHRFEQTTGQA
jgi:hypothetical protein